ncbi:MAG: hypothetical protein J6D03_03375 [Clostridia bacterium]|nr:hypothetical protein [Clostridia bacterium]
MEEKSKRYKRISFFIDIQSNDALDKLSAKSNSNKSEIIRKFVAEGLTVKTTRDDLDFICKVISKQIEVSLKKDIERIVSLIIKDILSSQNTNYLCVELLKEKNNLIDIREIKEKADRYAIEYLKNRNRAN